MKDGKWERRRILIWGKTRPELSRTYREIVCTGGVFEDTRKLVRLYPIPLRYLDDEKYFSKYQWIEADVTRSQSDARPESYKIRADNILVHETIPPRQGNWDERASWIMQENNVFRSVEALQEKQRLDHTSLGLIQPARIFDIIATPYSRPERENFWNKYQAAVAQMELPLDPETRREIKPLTPPDYRFKIRFGCNDPRCDQTHEFSVLDWEIDALYFKMRTQHHSPKIAADKVIQKLHEICGPSKDLHFYLGNISTHPQIFTIVGLWYPKKRHNSQGEQLSLFDSSTPH